MNEIVFTLGENIRKENYVIATYYGKFPADADIIQKASNLAIGQTIGTWVPIPGITDELRQKYMGKVVNIFEIPPIELSTQVKRDEQEYLLQIAYPAVNFGSDFPLMITALLGNDASTSAQVKLMDIEFPDEFLSIFHGPRFGINGIRKHFQVFDRPLLLNMVKPCTGITPENGARIFYEVALGGVDLIKDDELLGNPKYCKPDQRVKAYKEAAKNVYEKTGHKTYYIVNITAGTDEIYENVKRAEEVGADGIMVNFAVVGYSTLKYISEITSLPILGHSAGAGMYFEGTLNGMASPLAVGKLARLAGADMVMINTPYGGYPLRRQKYLQTVQKLTLPMGKIRPTMPSIGGGVHPGIVEKYIHEVGKDIVLASGGAIQGHEMGPCAGAKAMREAIDIVINGGDFLTAARQYPELQESIDRWGYVGD
jgi:2,3-diketo-5-methylthiopentyl-1-phosphate enolase